MNIKPITVSDEKWEAVRKYAEACPWSAGRTLAYKMSNNEFTDWERVIVALDDEIICGFCTVTKTDCIPCICRYHTTHCS